MKKIKYFLMILILLLNSISISFSNDNREVIKAYKNGKSAKLDIEVTKVRSDNYVDLFIDRSEKKIYRDITKSTRENSDLDRNLYVTTYLKSSDKTNTINDELSHKVVTIDGKRYLEISYFEEPKIIYLWVVKNNNVQKLYTGILKDFINPNNPITHINYNLIKKNKDKIYKIEKDYIIFKVGNVQLKNPSNRDISLTLHDDYTFKDKDMKDIPVKLFFSNNKKIIDLTKNSPSTDIFCYFKANNNSEIFGTYYLNDLEKTSKEFSLKIDFMESKSLKNNNTDLVFNNYEITPFALFNYSTNISSSSSANISDKVTFTRANFWFSNPSAIGSSNIFGLDGAISNSYLNTLTWLSKKTAIFETFDGSKITNLQNSGYNELNNEYFNIKFSNQQKTLNTSFFRKEMNIKKVTIILTWGIGVLAEDTIVINYFNEAPKFTLEVTKHMDFGYLYKNSNNNHTAEGEVDIISESNTLTYTTNIPDTITIYKDKAGSTGDNITVNLSNLTIENKKIKITGTISKSELNKKEALYTGFIPVAVTATENPTGGKF